MFDLSLSLSDYLEVCCSRFDLPLSLITWRSVVLGLISLSLSDYLEVCCSRFDLSLSDYLEVCCSRFDLSL